MKKILMILISITLLFASGCAELEEAGELASTNVPAANQVVEEDENNAEAAEEPDNEPEPIVEDEPTENNVIAEDDITVVEAFVERDMENTIRLATTCVKLRLQSKSNNLGPILNLIDRAALEAAPDIIVISESIFTRMNPSGVRFAGIDGGGSEELGGPVFIAMQDKAKEHGMYIIFNINAPYEGPEVEDRLFYNSNFLVSPEGEIVGRYDKNMLPPDEINAGLTPSTERPVFDIEIRGHTITIGMPICYDLDRTAYGPDEERVTTTLVNNGAEIIFVPTIGDYTFEAVKDAIEYGVYFVVAGQDRYQNDPYEASAIIDLEGKLLVKFTDRTGLPGQSYEQMQYRPGEDGSFGYVDVSKIKIAE